MLTAMGAQISGVGSSTLEVEGVERLSPVEHATVPDRIVAGTWAVAAVMTRGDVTVVGGRPEHLEMPLDKLVQAGAEVSRVPAGFRVVMDRRPARGRRRDAAVPGLRHRLPAAVPRLNTVAEGTAMITENVFESRWMFVNELVRLGAEVRTDGHHAVVRGREQLSGRR
jgi:UDP-N-acetylglucosamine 1-carboxyvinyltransferase